MFDDGCEIVDVGFDWFTTTSTEKQVSKLLTLKADVLLQQEERRGFNVRAWSMKGYSGFRCGRVEWGVRNDQCIVRLSSDMAAEHWYDVWQITRRCTRVDLQVTVRMSSDPVQTLLQMASEVQVFYRGRSDGPKVVQWFDDNDGATLYLGSRKSDLYFRAYNKAAESGIEEFDKCVRLELEVKKRLTESVLARVMSESLIRDGIILEVHSYLIGHGIPSKLSSDLPHSWNEWSRLVPDCFKSLAWLETQCKPTVQRLCDRGMVHEVVESLGLTDRVHVASTCGKTAPSKDEL